MTGLVRKATLLGVCGLLFAAIASASVPDPGHSTVPTFIYTGGVNATGVPDTLIHFTVTVNDITGLPINGSNVEVNFANCTDTKLCSVQPSPETVDCVAKAVRASTNALGQVTFFVLAGALDPGTSIPPAFFPGPGSGCVRVFADGIQLGTVTCVDVDQNGATPGNNGVNGADLSVLKNIVGAVVASGGTLYLGRADESIRAGGAPTINGADLSFESTSVGQTFAAVGSSKIGCGNSSGVAQPYCP